MSKETDLRFWRWANPMLWGIGLTAAVVLGGVLLARLPICATQPDGTQACQSKWASFLAASPNEVGDTLAGFAGVLAFIWIIVTVWLQSQELAEQRRELVNQREEMEGQRKASEEMAKAMTIQAEIFKKEQEDREKADNDRTVEELIKRLRTELPLAALRWSERGDGFGNQRSVNINPWAGPGSRDTPDDIFFIGYAKSLQKNFERVQSMAQSVNTQSKPKKNQLDTVHGLLVTILGVRPTSTALWQRVVNLRLAILADEVRRYQSADIWRAEDEGTS